MYSVNCLCLASYFGMTPLQMKVVETAIVKECAHDTQYKQNLAVGAEVKVLKGKFQPLFSQS